MFITIEDGADPIMKKVIGAKSMEVKKIMNPEAEVLASTGDKNKVLGMAKDWLRNKGVDVDSIIDEKEKESKGELYIFSKQGIQFEREAILSENSRVDFKVSDVLIECKAGSFSKREMLRQIKKYKKDYEKVKAIIIVSPAYMKHFKLKETPVYIVNTSDSSLLMEGLT